MLLCAAKNLCLGSPVRYLASLSIDAERCSLFFPFLFQVLVVAYDSITRKQTKITSNLNKITTT